MTGNRNDSNHPQEFKGAEISNFIKLLRRPLSDLTNTYSRPVSSILPEEREVDSSLLFDEIDIDAHYDRLSAWEGSISKKKIRDWLNQFETTLDKNIAHLLLSKFQFLSKSDIEVATRSLQEKLLDLLIEKESLREVFMASPNPKSKDDTNFRRWLRNKIIRYARLPSPPNKSVESQDRLWAIYERSALTSTSSPAGKKLRPLKEYFEIPSGEPQSSVFVFMDYTNGSGDTLKECIREINKILTDYPEWRNAFFVFLHIVQLKTFSLSSIECAPPKSDVLFYENMFHYKSPEVIELLTIYKISESEYDAFIEKYCFRASGELSLGYRQSGALTCHHYSCPNNTLPFFHKSSQNWEPLFRNSQTPSATRYRR